MTKKNLFLIAIIFIAAGISGFGQDCKMIEALSFLEKSERIYTSLFCEPHIGKIDDGSWVKYSLDLTNLESISFRTTGLVGGLIEVREGKHQRYAAGYRNCTCFRRLVQLF